MFDVYTVSQIFLISCAGGIIGLDRTAVGQFMISQPVVAAPLAGWILGDVQTGLIIGVLLELLWLLDIPVGTFVPADSTIAAIFATAVAILGGTGGRQPSLMGFSILLTAVLAPVTMAADRFIRNRNSRLADFALYGPGDAERRLTRAHLSGLVVFFLKFFVLFLVFIPAGIAAARWFGGAPEVFHRAMTLFVRLLPLLGAASVLCKLSVKTLDGFLLLGFAATVVMGFLIRPHALALALIAAAVGWLGVRMREGRAQS